MANCRISIANLAWSTASTDTGEVRSIAILRPKDFDKGKRIWGALGGAAMLTPEGKAWLEKSFQAEQFGKDNDNGFYDMRFVVDEKHVEQIFQMFAKPVDLEYDPTLDIMHELSENAWDEQVSLMSKAGTVQIDCTYDKTVRQRLVDPMKTHQDAQLSFRHIACSGRSCFT